ncbi:chromodomain-helicase [Thalassiosira pseudonana CCMP1335]
MEEEVLDEKNAILAAAEAAILGKKEKPSYALGFEEALKLKDKAIFDTGNDFRKRMDISRINPGSCPVVRKLASQQEFIKSKKDGSSLRYKAVTSNTDREEVFLIKWRGRSYMHCSWERKRDLEKFDHSTQLGSARGKINRYIQSSNDSDKDEEEYFSPLHLEVDRILGCDENELDMNDGTWDPEDNVRYIVRWKGLQLTEATWEYWIDIKRDFVDEVEDFWRRQQAPSDKLVKEISGAPHPHPRSFRKLTESPVFDTGSVLKLRAYQLEGVNWLLWNWYNRRSCILADEMGLGKTIQSIGFLHELQRVPKAKNRGPFLVVAPLSLVAQWASESKEWAPDMNVVVYHGSADARDFLVKHEFYYTDQFSSKTVAQQLKRKHITKFQVLITTYEVVLKDVNVLSKIKWKALIVDEAHRLKNIKARLFEDLASVPRDFCLLLTGTPLQNSTEELWALLHFCDPKTFGSRDEFTEQFGQLENADQVANLHTVLRPYLLRRVKEDVEKALPPKEETILEVTLTPIQKTFYKAIYERNTSFLYKGSKPSNAPSLMNIMMELRKCCNHPFLIRGAEDRIIGNDETAYRPIDYAKLTGEQLVKSSGKFVLLSKLLPKLYDGGHKVLIFSQMVRVLDLLQELLQLKHYRYERLDGSTSASSRNAAVDRFKRESFKRFVMLLSTRAGGLGLNLTAADTVIIFDRSVLLR